MKKFKVETPNKRFNGIREGCQFENGVHICDDELKVKLFESFGYSVEEIVEKKEAPKNKKKTDK